MLLETKVQEMVIYVGLIVFLFISPFLNIVYIPILAKTPKSKWRIR